MKVHLALTINRGQVGNNIVLEERTLYLPNVTEEQAQVFRTAFGEALETLQDEGIDPRVLSAQRMIPVSRNLTEEDMDRIIDLARQAALEAIAERK